MCLHFTWDFACAAGPKPVEAYPVTTGRHKCKTTFSASVDTVCHKVASVRQTSHAGFVLVSLRKGRGKPGRTQRIKMLTVLVCVASWRNQKTCSRGNASQKTNFLSPVTSSKTAPVPLVTNIIDRQTLGISYTQSQPSSETNTVRSFHVFSRNVVSGRRGGPESRSVSFEHEKSLFAFLVFLGLQAGQNLI